jgi:tellurite resistance protein TerC
MFEPSFLLWTGFTVGVLLLLALDLGVFHRRSHVIALREALAWVGVWIALALVFNAGIVMFHPRGLEAGLEFFTGYLVEKSLSIDNIFVFGLIFGFFNVPQAFQHKVLFWGILGAIVLRAGFIVGGLALLERFSWMSYVFGAFLVFTGLQMMRGKEQETDPERNWLVRLFRRFVPVSDRYDGDRFFTRIDGRLAATPLLLVLVAIESSDIIFAVDSIPAIFAITQEPFIVYASNIFAMFGLRSLYFAVSGFMRMFHFLHYGFASIVLILGVKMLAAEYVELPIAVTLVIILVILLVCVIISLLRPRQADLKMMFERPEKLGLMPFRRLLLIENVVDFGDLRVCDAMRRCSGVRMVRLDLPWEENLRLMREAGFSRYPVVEGPDQAPAGVLHLKELFLQEAGDAPDAGTLRKWARPTLNLTEELSLDEALAAFQRGNAHFAVVYAKDGKWSGIITLEDVLEELVGKIGDEFESRRGEAPISLADALTPGRVVLGIEGASLPDAVRELIGRVPEAELPGDNRAILAAVLQRETVMTTYLGQGLAVPHCRLENLEKPVLIFGRASSGIPVEGSNERAELIFLLLTPGRIARLQPRLLADIVGLMDSDYVTERLKKAEEPEEIIEAVRAGQQVILD